MSAVLFGIAGKKEGAEGGINRDSFKKSCRAFQKIHGVFFRKSSGPFSSFIGGLSSSTIFQNKSVMAGSKKQTTCMKGKIALSLKKIEKLCR